MRVGLTFGNSLTGADPQLSTSLAEAVEDLGIESIWTVDHVVVPEGYVTDYPYAKDGKMPGPSRIPIPDPLTWLAWVAAHTTNVRLGTGILTLPLRNPVVLSKQLATLDVLSAGRLELGVGVGWLKEEFEAVGVPFERRGDRTDEYIGALRALWSEDESYEGTFVSFRAARSYPKPTRRIPIHIGGDSRAAARRAGRLGDGFFPWQPASVPKLRDELHRAAVGANRNPADIEVTCRFPNDRQEAEKMVELGVTRFVLSLKASDLEDLEARLVPRVERVREWST